MHDFSIRSHFRRIQSLKKSCIPNNELILKGGTAECAERLNPPPPNGRAGRAKLVNGHELHLLWPVQDFQPEILDPISFSLPQGSAHSAGPAPKGRESIAFSHFWSIFTPSKKWLEFYLEKIGPKMQKSWIWGSPNPPKTDPKSFLNRGRQKVMIFH